MAERRVGGAAGCSRRSIWWWATESALVKPTVISATAARFQPRHGRLRAQMIAAVGQPAAGGFERWVVAQDVEIVGILVAAADRQDPSAAHVGDGVHDERGITLIGHASRQPRRQAQTPFRHRPQHPPAVRRHSPAAEHGRDFLALPGWKRGQRNRIVVHGGCGRRENARRVGLCNQIFGDYSALRYNRRFQKPLIMTKMG